MATEINAEEPEELKSSVIVNYLSSVMETRVKPAIKNNRFENMWYHAPRPKPKISDIDVFPDRYYYPDLFVWAPDVLFKLEIKCPKCLSASKADGLPIPLFVE